MKKISITLLLSFIILISFAQIQSEAPLPANTSSDSSAQPRSTLRQQIQVLNLTKDQKMQFRQVRQNSKATREAIMANDSLTQDQKQTQLKALHKQTFTSFKAILTDEQMEKWKSMRAERKNKNEQQQNEAMEEEIMSLPAN